MAIRVFIRQDNLTASTKTTNLLNATDLQSAPGAGEVTVYGVSSALGINIEVGVAGGKAVSDREIPFIGTSIDQSAHEIVSFPVGGGEAMSLFLRETAASATTDCILLVEWESQDE